MTAKEKYEVCQHCTEQDCIWTDETQPAPEGCKFFDPTLSKSGSTYYSRNRDKCIAKVKRYNAAHKEELKDYQREYNKRPEVVERRKKKYRLKRKNPEFIQKQRETKNKRFRERYASEPEFREKCLEKSRKDYHLKKEG